MSLSPHSFTLSPEELPTATVNAVAVRDILAKRGIDADRHAQIVHTFNDGVRDYLITRMREERGARRSDVAEYEATLNATLGSMADLLGLSSSRFPLAARAIIQSAQLQGRIPSGQYTRELFNAVASYARAVAPVLVQVGESPRGKEGLHMRQARFASQFLGALRGLVLPTRTGRNSLATLLFCECLNAIGEPLHIDTADKMLREEARRRGD